MITKNGIDAMALRGEGGERRGEGGEGREGRGGEREGRGEGGEGRGGRRADLVLPLWKPPTI
jgi:hypothetical protein